MHYSVSTSEGIFRIIPDVKCCRLYLNDVYLGKYATPDHAALGVAGRKTGWDVWDRGTGDVPRDLSAWQANGVDVENIFAL